MDLLDIMQNLTIEQVPLPNEQWGDVNKETYINGYLNDVPTEIGLIEFTHKKALIVTQFQKNKSMLMVQKDRVVGPMGTIDIYSSKVIYGASADEIQIAARSLAEIINTAKPLCVLIDLKSYDMKTVDECKKLISNYIKKPKRSQS